MNSAPSRAGFLHSFSGLGLILGILFFAASLTPSLVPRAPLIQGGLGGVSLAAGYGIGVLLRALWLSLHLPIVTGRVRHVGNALAAISCIGAAGVALWWAETWQNRLRALMGMAPIDNIGALTAAGTALAVFLIVILIARLFWMTKRRMTRRMARRVPGPLAALVALIATALIFWSLGNGVLISGVMRLLDNIYSELDERIEATSPQPTDPLKTGAEGSLLTWNGLGRTGRQFISAGPDADKIAVMTSAPALEPLRVYVGLNSADDPKARAKLALAELIRVGAFARANLVIATPTGTGWVDPESQTALEYLLHGDVATVAVQYSYLASWIALLSTPDYGKKTATAVFSEIYTYWTNLPHDTRPRLYLHGLSLGAYNSDLSHDLFQVITDPYDGAMWSGPPFNARTWSMVTAQRNPDSPAWLPTFRDGSVIRFTAQDNQLKDAPAPWGTYRIVFLQYASDAITFYDPSSLWRKPDWMTPPLGPDVSPDFVWIPVVTFLQLTFDLMLALVPPIGHGHLYAFPHYLDAWAALTDAPGWTPEGLEALKARVATAP